jgi:hypothetical protein
LAPRPFFHPVADSPQTLDQDLHKLFSPQTDWPWQYRGMAGRKKMSSDEMRKHIHSFRGKFKLDTGGKSFSQWWSDHKRVEKELEERKFQRLAALGKK